MHFTNIYIQTVVIMSYNKKFPTSANLESNLIVFFPLLWSPLLPGADATERIGSYSTLYTGIPQDAPGPAWRCDQKSGILISSFTATTKRLCSLRQTTTEKLAGFGVRQELKPLLYDPC